MTPPMNGAVRVKRAAAVFDSPSVRPACSESGRPVILDRMPMKCEKREKEKG